MRAISSITPAFPVPSPQPNPVPRIASVPSPPPLCPPPRTWSAWAFQTSHRVTTWLHDSQDDITAATAILATVGAVQWSQGNTGYGSVALCASAGLLAGRYCVRSAHELLASVRQTSHQVLHDDIPHSIDHAQVAVHSTADHAANALQTASRDLSETADHIAHGLTVSATTVGHNLAETADHTARELAVSATAMSHQMAETAQQTARELAATITLASRGVAVASQQTTHDIIATVGRDITTASHELAASATIVARNWRRRATRAASWGAAGLVVLCYGPAAAALISWETLAVLLAGVPGMLAAAGLTLTGFGVWWWRHPRTVVPPEASLSQI